MKKIFFFLSIILVLTVVVLRFYKLGSIPGGLTSDEAHYLYDAYSIGETGRDIRGVSYPLMFKSTGEYKLNLTYLVTLAINFVGLNPTAARLPSAIFGLASLGIIAILTYELTKNKLFSLIAVVVLALSPWHFGISRLFYESNVGVFFVLLGLYLGYKRHMSWAGLALAIAAYLYNPFRYLGAGFLLLFMFLDIREKKFVIKQWLMGLLVYLLALSPLLFIAPKESLKRLSQGIDKSNSDATLVVDQARMNCYLFSSHNPFITKACYLLWNKPVNFLENYGKTFVALLSPNYLFYESSDLYILPSTYGAYLPYLLPFYLLGLVVLIIQVVKGARLPSLIFFGLIGMVLIVSSDFTGSLLHKNTFGLMMVMLIIIMGFYFFLNICSKIRLGSKYLMIIAALYLGIAVFQTSKYILNYFYLHTVSYPLMFMYDAPEIYRYLESKKDYQYIVDHKFFAPVYAGIYWRIDPHRFQELAKWQEPDKYGFQNVAQMDNLYFGGFTTDYFLCLKKETPSEPISAVVVDDPTGKYASFASHLTHDATGSLVLNAVYDIDELYEQVKGVIICK